ncbi:DUF4330 domain-containing protein [Haloarcula nitratireducens]|uniref:DUF4330 domain-containing protein n=1 Tax=Haloarcula nitratireducens TaxID=2487749 RepID=A0AAW4PJJ7_9EURY|nr:DUF4330 domain-containing protein [Halomicroarcula nitratireducens]MBX0297884.1 DUF4330 domain-containing protein [Halomicroarcula nitratireducens]
MPFLDDDGNLFGLVNVVDALVVLLVLAVAIAGAALVFQPEPEPDSPDYATTNATLDLGTQPASIVAAINEGDTYNASSTSQLTITDVYLTPQGAETHVVLRVQLRGTPTGDSLTYADAPPRIGRLLDITTNRYQVNGNIRSVGGDNALDTETTTVVLRDMMATADAEAVAPGDEIRITGRTVATIENVTTYATNDPAQRRVFVEADLQTYQQLGDRRFGGTQVRRGQSITLPAEQYVIDGKIEQIGSGIDGTTANRTVTLRMNDVREDMAEAFEPGMTERTGGKTVARVTNVSVEPSLMITTGQNGSVNVVEHPLNREVTLTTELRVRETASGVQFKGQPIRQGSSVVLDLGTITVEAQVVSIGS